MNAEVALVTYSGLPELDPDDRPLAAALGEAGIATAITLWDDPAIDWSSFALVVLRSPWDYHRRIEAFLAWATRVAAVTELLNALPALRWNLDKRYLIELAEKGAPVVPTARLERSAAVDLAALAAERGWRDLVVKPAISADSWETHHVGGDFRTGQGIVDRLLPERDLLVQPFLPTVEDYGERCLVFLDGSFSHAVRKNALTRGGRWTELPEGVPVAATAEERDAAERVLAAAGFRDLLYARVDLVHDSAGAPLLLELELAEPTLFLRDAPAGLARLVAALAARLEGTRR